MSERASPRPWSESTTSRSRSAALWRPSSQGPLARLAGHYYCEIRDERIPVVGQSRAVAVVFEQAAADYTLPVIVYKQVTPAQIHEVFSLYNKQGKHLNAEELNALYHRLIFMRALLVTAGDYGDLQSAAPFLGSDWDDLSSAPRVLDHYQFGRAGYKRTKVISWISLQCSSSKTATRVHGRRRNKSMHCYDGSRRILEIRFAIPTR